MTGANRRTTSKGASGRPLLVVAPVGAGRDEIFKSLCTCAAYRLFYAVTAASAERMLREHAVEVVIASPEISSATVSQLLLAKRRLRPDAPFLVIRNRQAEEPELWAKHGVGVLRCPLLPEALGRSVDLVLGLGKR